MDNNLFKTGINVYLGRVLEDVPLLFILEKHLNKRIEIKKNLWNLFQGERLEQEFDFISLVSDPEQADFLILPHNYFLLKKIKGDKKDSYISIFVFLARKYNKKILVFGIADSDEDIDVPCSIIFRYSQYGYKQKKNEIIIPPYAPSFSSLDFMWYREKMWKDIVFRNKAEKPAVSFCGWAGFPSFYRRMTYEARVFVADVKALIFRDKHAVLHKRGIYYRREAMRALEKSTSINTNFIVRRSYAAQKGLDGLRVITSEEAEKEYIDSIINSDFVLAPKGNGNASIRFFEALSLGRFPVLINTDCVLPLADVIKYDNFVVKVDYNDMASLERRIIDFYNALSNEEFHKRQQQAREAFNLLRPVAFLKKELFLLKTL